MMQSEQKNQIEASEVKPDRTFQRAVWLQIYLPFIFILLILGAVVAILWVSGSGTYSGWADAALVILMIPALLVGVIIFAILVGLCYGVIYIFGQIPKPARRAQEIASRISVETRRFADLAARPLLVPKAAKTAMVETLRYFISIFSKEG
jgi:hypothetical protein